MVPQARLVWSYVKFSIRKLFVVLIIGIVIGFIIFRHDQLIDLVETMKRGSLIPLIAAILTQLGKYFAQSFSYSFAFSAVEERMPARNTLPLVFGSFFMNTIAPSLNMAGATLVVDDARRRGIPAGKATSAALLMQMSIEGGFVTIMIIGFTILQISGNLNPLWFLLGIFVVAMIAVMGIIMLVGNKKPKTLTALLGPIERLVNRIRARFKKKPLKPWREKVVASFGEAAGLIAHNPKSAAKVFGCSVIASTCELACFCLVGIAFDVPIPQALICGYVLATLLAMISVTPQGVGVVELVVPGLLVSYGISYGAGLAVLLVYRGLVFWMPFLIGAVLIQRTKFFKGDKKKKAVPGDVLGSEQLEGRTEFDEHTLPEPSPEPDVPQGTTSDEEKRAEHVCELQQKDARQHHPE